MLMVVLYVNFSIFTENYRLFMKKLILLIFMLAAVGVSSAQTLEEIKGSPDVYLYGMGSSVTVARADNMALTDLISQIAVVVESDITMVDSEDVDGNVKSEFMSVMNSYSTATLNNTNRIIINNEPKAEVLRYIKRSEIDRIFESRKVKVLEMVRLADKALEQNRIDNALKYYYWSYVLVKSLRYPNEPTYTSEDGVESRLIVWLPNRINSIFSELRVVPDGELDESVYRVKWKYRDRDVASLDFTYYDGADWGNIQSVRDGMGLLELRPNVDIKNLDFKCEYEFTGEALMDDEIKSIIESMEPAIFSSAYMKVANVAATVVDSKATKKAEVNSRDMISDDGDGVLSPLVKIMLDKSKQLDVYNVGAEGDVNISQVQDMTEYTGVVTNVITAIRGKSYESVRGLFTADGYDMFTKLIRYGNAVVMNADPELKCIGINGDVVCRSVPMSFSFSGNRRKFVENVSFIFDEQGKIDNITFCLDADAQRGIMEVKEWPESSKIVIITFLENYKTAFALKRWDYLNAIFDDNALIITGKVLERTNNSESITFMNNRYVKLTKQSKAQYMQGLKRVFASNQYVNLKFANSEVIRLGGGGELYGIQIKQDYYSTNYADSGYLFLMVDLNNYKRPLIHVRTWQEIPDPNFGLIDPYHF